MRALERTSTAQDQPLASWVDLDDEPGNFLVEHPCPVISGQIERPPLKAATIASGAVRRVLTPRGAPSFEHLFGKIKLLSHVSEVVRRKDCVYRIQNLRDGAKGHIQRFACVDSSRSGGIVKIGDLLEKPRITTAPAVDGLLGVADVEERASASITLDHLVDEIAQRVPLQSAGVLKFIKQPVIIRAIQAGNTVPLG